MPTSGCARCVPLNTFGKFARNCSRVISPTTVTSSRPSSIDAFGRDVHAARVRGAVADRDEPRAHLVRLAVDGEPERMRLVHRQRAEHGGDVERGAGEPLDGVGPPVGFGVEARRSDARVPAAVDAAEVDDALVAVRERVERVERMLRVVAEACARSRCPRRSARSRACDRCRPRRRRPRRRARRRRTPRDRGPASAAARASRGGSSGVSDTSTFAPTAAARSSIAGSSRRVRPRPATGLTISRSMLIAATTSGPQRVA